MRLMQPATRSLSWISVRHLWAGEGGMLEWQEEELDRMAGDDWKKREACRMASWIKPKMQHKAFVQRLLQLRAHLILCFRAEEKVEMVKDDNGKTRIVPKRSTTGLDGWMPVCEKSLPYELTVSFLLMPDNPGVPHPNQAPGAAQVSCSRPVSPLTRKPVGALQHGPQGQRKSRTPQPLRQAFKALGWAADAIDQTVGKPIAEWTPADVNIARQAYRKATAQKAATI